MVSPDEFAPEPESNQKLISALAIIGAEPGIPSFQEVMNSILGLLDDPNMRLPDLSRTLEKDFNLCLKLTRTANSALYNRSGQPIRGIDHVIMLLGARAVRELAGSMMYFNLYSQRPGGLKELLLLSLLTAQTSREMAIHVNYEAPERVFLGGMFHNLGQVLVAAHFPNEHAEIRHLAERVEEPEESTVRKVLGFDFAELGEAIGRKMGLPESVLLSMRRDSDGLGIEETIVTFGHELALASFAAPAQQKTAYLEAVKRKYLPILQLTAADVAGFLRSAISESSTVFSDAGSRIDNLRLLGDVDLAEATWAKLDKAERASEESVPG